MDSAYIKDNDQLTACDINKSQIRKYLIVDKAKNYIQENLSEEITLDRLAKHVNCSIFHFCRVFKWRTGMAPHHYMIHVRIQKAKAMLLDSHAPISDISIEVGYSLCHFTKLFKRETSFTPRAYRKMFSANSIDVATDKLRTD